jgi:hypothetical protein
MFTEGVERCEQAGWVSAVETELYELSASAAAMKKDLGVAETRADSDLVASLGTPATEHGCARLGLHPGKEPVGLRAVAAVRLEGTLRH